MTKNPERQAVLVGVHSPLRSAVESERTLLEYPLFDVSKSAKKRKLSYERDGVSIEIKAVEGEGIATIYDKDVILYAASLIRDQIKNGLTPEKEVRFTAYDFQRICGRDNAGDSYDRISAALERLKGTLIRTNIEIGKRGKVGLFNWLDSGTELEYDIDEATGERKLQFVRVVLSEWLFTAIVGGKKFLTVHKGYFDLAPVERRLYDLARVYVSDNESWEVPLGVLREMIGCDMTPSQLKSTLLKVQKMGLPEYALEVTDRRLEAVEKASRGRPSVASLLILFRSRPGAALAPRRRGGARTTAQDPSQPTLPLE
jgi:plasmid replication initiation protein